MPTLTVPLPRTDGDYLSQVRYALAFLSEDVVSYDLSEEKGNLSIEFHPTTDVQSMRTRLDQLLHRYDHREFGMKSVVYFENKRELSLFDAWEGMLERRWATPVGEGHVIL